MNYKDVRTSVLAAAKAAERPGRAILDGHVKPTKADKDPAATKAPRTDSGQGAKADKATSSGVPAPRSSAPAKAKKAAAKKAAAKGK